MEFILIGVAALVLILLPFLGHISLYLNIFLVIIAVLSIVLFISIRKGMFGFSRFKLPKHKKTKFMDCDYSNNTYSNFAKENKNDESNEVINDGQYITKSKYDDIKNQIVEINKKIKVLKEKEEKSKIYYKNHYDEGKVSRNPGTLMPAIEGLDNNNQIETLKRKRDELIIYLKSKKIIDNPNLCVIIGRIVTLDDNSQLILAYGNKTKIGKIKCIDPDSKFGLELIGKYCGDTIYNPIKKKKQMIVNIRKSNNLNKNNLQ